MKIIKYVFALLLLITSNSKIISMDFDDTHCRQIREVGMTADIEGAQRLLDKGMPVNARGFLGFTMLLHAMAYVHETDTNKIPEEKRSEFVDFLISKGAELHPSTDSWTKVPVLAAQSSNIGPKFLDLLKKRGADLSVTHPDNGMTALHLAAWNGHLSVVDYLLDQKETEVDTIDKEGMTPLIRASFWGYAKVVEKLVHHDARTDIKDHSERSALDYAKLCTETGEWRNGEATRLFLQQ